ncbi:MAG: 3,4-dihydroxy-2-butanone-4-phosphate synthase [Candidatus Gracilibacteria bacterium]|nr:3,4-dihydroxy-2-butanone-4-phosphate synthase [Candidatus Gracilibacteria bacterium]
MFDSVHDAVADIRQGKMIIVVDSEDRENEGDLIMSAELCMPEDINFMITHARGLVCTPLERHRAMKLSLPLMLRKNEDKDHCRFTVSCDLREGITTGISAADRARTVRALADDLSVEGDFVSPGHVFPIIADTGGLAARQGHTEATVALMQLAGLTPVGVICEIIREDGEMVRGDDLLAFKKKHALKLITIEALREHLGIHLDTIIDRQHA